MEHAARPASVALVFSSKLTQTYALVSRRLRVPYESTRMPATNSIHS
jgi:hypothetical protein